jgi:hypothetical protein
MFRGQPCLAAIAFVLTNSYSTAESLLDFGFIRQSEIFAVCASMKNRDFNRVFTRFEAQTGVAASQDGLPNRQVDCRLAVMDTVVA